MIASHVSLDAFLMAIDRGPHLRIALVELAAVVVTLCTDSFSTRIGLIACRTRRPLAKVFPHAGETAGTDV